MNISLVVPTFNRDSERLDRLLTTTEWQLSPFHEVIIVDASTNHEFKEANEKACLYRARYLPIFMSKINFPFMFNLGIRETTPDVDYIACANVDILFDSSFTLVLGKLLDGGTEFSRSQCAILPENADYINFGTEKNWKALLSIARRRFALGHAVLCAHRTWWYRVRGYDETLSSGLGVFDGDIRKRAEKDGLKMGYTLYSDAPLLHQWHPKSPLKNYNRPRWDTDPPIVKNLSSWGGAP